MSKLSGHNGNFPDPMDKGEGSPQGTAQGKPSRLLPSFHGAETLFQELRWEISPFWHFFSPRLIDGLIAPRTDLLAVSLTEQQSNMVDDVQIAASQSESAACWECCQSCI